MAAEAVKTIERGAMAATEATIRALLKHPGLSGYPAPWSGPTPQDSFIATWDHGRHHFEVESFRGAWVEWFYCDRKADECEGSEGDLRAAANASVFYLQRVFMTDYDRLKAAHPFLMWKQETLLAISERWHQFLGWIRGRSLRLRLANRLCRDDQAH